MKTKQQIIQSKPVFLNDWEGDESFDVFMEFEGVHISAKEYKAKRAPYENKEYWLENKEQAKTALEKHTDEKILFASYTYEDYSGNAFVLFTKNGKLFEVNGSHCSCDGLEYQWTPEEVNLKELRHRVTKGTFGLEYSDRNEFSKELKEFLGLKPTA